MKAVVYTKYGPPDVLSLQEVDKPLTKSNEVMIKIHATTVTSRDCRLRGLMVPLLIKLPMRLWLGLKKPTRSILGVDLAGEIVETGEDVKRFKVGDKVFGSSFDHGFGCYAQYGKLDL